jgi:hypothetical protein
MYSESASAAWLASFNRPWFDSVGIYLHLSWGMTVILSAWTICCMSGSLTGDRTSLCLWWSFLGLSLSCYQESCSCLDDSPAVLTIDWPHSADTLCCSFGWWWTRFHWSEETVVHLSSWSECFSFWTTEVGLNSMVDFLEAESPLAVESRCLKWRYLSVSS